MKLSTMSAICISAVIGFVFGVMLSGGTGHSQTRGSSITPWADIPGNFSTVDPNWGSNPMSPSNPFWGGVPGHPNNPNYGGSRNPC